MLKYRKHLLGLAMSLSIATVSFADDSVPVYDADNFPPQFDNSSDVGSAVPQGQPDQTYVPPPAPRTLSSEQHSSPKVDPQVQRRLDDSAKVEALQSEVQSLRGQVEQLTHQLQQMQSQQRTMYSDLEKRINTTSKAATNAPSAIKMASDDTISVKQAPIAAKMPSKPIDATKPVSTEDTSSTLVTAKVTPPQPNVAEEQQIYQTAYNLIKAKKYNDAVVALQKMLQKYPSGQFAANAHYWLGELYGLMGNNEQSAVEFAAVVKNYPDSPKVSDAQLKLGLIYAAAFKWSDAKVAFKKIINRYPGTASARLAAEQLKQIKDAGH